MAEGGRCRTAQPQAVSGRAVACRARSPRLSRHGDPVPGVRRPPGSAPLRRRVCERCMSQRGKNHRGRGRPAQAGAARWTGTRSFQTGPGTPGTAPPRPSRPQAKGTPFSPPAGLPGPASQAEGPRAPPWQGRPHSALQGKPSFTKGRASLGALPAPCWASARPPPAFPTSDGRCPRQGAGPVAFAGEPRPSEPCWVTECPPKPPLGAPDLRGPCGGSLRQGGADGRCAVAEGVAPADLAAR